MYITEPKKPLTIAYECSQERQHHRIAALADANSRYTYFQALQEINDPTELCKPRQAKALRAVDYLASHSSDSQTFLTQAHLSRLKQRIENAALLEEKENAHKAKQAQFIHGLLGK